MKIVQFLHPGGEQDEKNGVDWNLGNHQRKFIKSNGTILDSKQNPQIGTLGFWGEWEAPSNYVKTENSADGLPKFITEPYYYMGNKLRNTDPFVFGNQFYYTICQQGHSTQLRELEAGDIIMFGSAVKDKFVLDTLFVVDDYFNYYLNNIDRLKDKVNEVFYDVTLLPIMKSQSIGALSELIEDKGAFKPNESCLDYDEKAKCITDEGIQHRVYKGLMHSNKSKERFGNIFSYVPAVSLNEHQNGFARPNIVLDNIITQNHRQGLKITPRTKEEGIELWHNITNQVIEQGLGLMVECELPEKK